MTHKERIIHTLLFEAIALTLTTTAAVMFTGRDILSMSGLAILLSAIAMVWNYIYNYGFDHFFGNNRIQRSIKMRLGHGIGFEIGMLAFSLPALMWVLQLDIVTIFIMDIGVAIFFIVYAIVFNYAYDHLRPKLFVQFATQ